MRTDRTPPRRRRIGPAAGIVAIAVLGTSPGDGGAALGHPAAHEPPPSPYAILGTRQLEPPRVDAIAFCIPPDLDPGLVETARRVAAGDVEAAAERYAARQAVQDSRPPEERLFAATLAARRADGRAATRGARREIRAALAAGGSDAARACAHLEAARLDLLLRRFPEAAVRAERARRLAAGGTQAPRLDEAARFYRAEALYLSGWRSEAGVLYRELARSENPRTAAAARLRVADLRFDAGEPAAVLRDYETLLKRAAAFGASLEGWALRASEAALAAGHGAAAATWAKRVLDEGDEREGRSASARAAVSLRLADIDALLGDGQASRSRLESIADEHADRPLGALAVARMVDLGVDSHPPAERIARLRAAAQSRHRGVALYALSVLGHELSELGEVDEALAVLTRLSYDAPPRWLAPRLSSDIDAVLREAAMRSDDGSDCLGFVRRVGGRYVLLAHRASRIEPLLRLGGCYEELGLPAIAMRVYRTLARAFGGNAAGAVALPLARTALANGDLGLVRTAAAGRVRIAGQHRPWWLLLLAEAELRDGKDRRAAELLRDLVRANPPRELRGRVVLTLARALVRRPSSSEDTALLTRAVDALAPEERRADPAAFGEAALLAAELQRRQGRRASARRLYAQAVGSLPPGPMRSEAGYWLGALDEDLASATESWQQTASGENAGPWTGLAKLELRISGLRAQLGTWPPEAIRETR